MLYVALEHLKTFHDNETSNNGICCGYCWNDVAGHCWKTFSWALNNWQTYTVLNIMLPRYNTLVTNSIVRIYSHFTSKRDFSGIPKIWALMLAAHVTKSIAAESSWILKKLFNHVPTPYRSTKGKKHSDAVGLRLILLVLIGKKTGNQQWGNLPCPIWAFLHLPVWQVHLLISLYSRQIFSRIP